MPVRPVGGMLRGRFQEQMPKRVSMEVIMHEDQIIEIFQHRRKRMLQNFGVCMILIALSLVITQVADHFPYFLGIRRMMWVAIGIAQFVAGVVFGILGFLQYRCPVCSEIIRWHYRYYLGVTIDPDKCPNCGTRLSWPHDYPWTFQRFGRWNPPLLCCRCSKGGPVDHSRRHAFVSWKGLSHDSQNANMRKMQFQPKGHTTDTRTEEKDWSGDLP